METFQHLVIKYTKQQSAFDAVKQGQLTFAYQLQGSSGAYYSYGNCTLKVLYEMICVNHNGGIHLDTTGCVNEVINENTNRRMYFDIDVNQPNCTNEDINSICKAMLKIIFPKLHDRNLCQMIVLSATTNKKLSLHIIFPEIRVSSRQKLINLIGFFFPKFVISNCGRFGDIQVDVSVYNKNSVFRMIYNRKVGKNNTLFPIAYIFNPRGKETETYFKTFEFFKKTVVSTDEPVTCDHLADNEYILPNPLGSTSKRKRNTEPGESNIMKVRKIDKNCLSDEKVAQFKTQVSLLVPHKVQQYMKHICGVRFNSVRKTYTMFGTGYYKFCMDVGREHKSNNVLLNVHKDENGKITQISQYCYKCNNIENNPPMVLYLASN